MFAKSAQRVFYIKMEPAETCRRAILVQMVGLEPTGMPILNRVRLPIAPHLQMVRPGRIELPTHRLKVCCSTG